MSHQFWVGRLPDVGEIVYDPSIQDDRSDFVRLFEIRDMAINSYSRAQTSQKLEAVQSPTDRQRCVRIYQEWSERHSKSEIMGWSSRNGRGGSGSSQTDDGDLWSEEEKRIDDLEAALTSRAIEITKLQNELQTTKAELQFSEEALTEALKQIRDLQCKATAETSLTIFQRLSKNAAYYASGCCEQFRELIISLEVDDSLPLHLASALEDCLRPQLQQPDSAVGLFFLISQAGERDVLDDQGVSMAHILCQQRDAVTRRNGISAEELTARSLLALYAAAILWSRLPAQDT